MSKGRVLVIDGDEWSRTLLVNYLGAAGYEVHTAAGAREGFDRVRALEPDCIVCDVALPDIDGFWVARRVRAEASKVAATPLLFLTQADDLPGRLHGLKVGADVFLTKPVRSEEIVAQVDAVIGMASRILSASVPPTEAPPPSSRPPALAGDLSQISIATVFTLLELEQRSGLLRVRNNETSGIDFELSQGALCSAKRSTNFARKHEEPKLLLHEVLNYGHGTFKFRPGKVEKAPLQQKLSALLLDAMRLHDEDGGW
ncbi:MAG TPA: response regulator [Polyangiaceae bacterium]|nr:response regulator [Polyangiaceae bacterium]